jgi:DNA-binding Lrp family transcriptional regulator
MRVWAYVFITTTNPGPRKAVQAIRKIAGVVKADALFGAPDVIAIVEGSDLHEMDAVIDAIVELPEVVATETKVARWIE